MNCDAFAEPLNALLDGELPPAEAANVTAHLANCPACARLFSELAQLRADLETLIPEEQAPPALLARVEAMLADEGNATGNIVPLIVKPTKHRARNFSLAAITAIAAMLTVISLPRHSNINELSSVRDAALRSGISNSPLVANGPTLPGYRLTSFRNDIVSGHPAQVEQYTANGQVFTLCIWPAYDEPPHSKRLAAYKGMQITEWADGENEYWAASTAPTPQLQAFAAKVSAS